MNEADAQHAHDLSNEELVIFASGFGRQVHFAQARRRVARIVRNQLHDQYVVEVTIGLRHADIRGDELIQRVNFSILPRGLLLLAAEAGAFAHGARLAAAAHFASFLVLRALLEASLPHVTVDLCAANL